MPAAERALRRVLPLAAALAVVAGAGLLLWRAAAPPSGPVEVPWDRVSCAHCRMLVSDPRYAGQLHTPAGEVLFFDDPGCLLLHGAGRESARAVFFRDSRAERWLAAAEVGFVRVPETPMGYGFAAVARDAEPGALSPAEALAALEAAAPGSAPR
jgi:copper chaperone NosL